MQKLLGFLGRGLNAGLVSAGVISITLASALAGDFRVGLVLDRGGKDDKSFNAAAFKGGSEAEKKLKIDLKTVEASDDNAFEPMLRSLSQKKFDLIIAVGIAQADAVKKIAAQFPDRKYAIIDAQVDAPNVTSLLFEEHEGSYIVGAAAALASKSGKLGFLGGVDIPLIRRFQMGYEAGAKKINPKATVVANYVGVTTEAWNNPAKGRELALSQYDSGVDVIFAAAGASGNGMFDAAEERSKSGTKRFAIGVDSNQNWIKPGLVLTSMLKRVDTAVLSTIENTKNGKFAAGTQRFGLQNSGIDYAVDSHNEKLLTPDMRSKLDALKKEIISGKIKVPDYYLARSKTAQK
jgi:basic membrane protein A